MEDLRNQFPILNDYTYLNTASSGLLAQDILKWRRAHDEEFLNMGSIFREDHYEFLDGVRQTAARFFGAETDELALVPNFSFGINTFLEGLPEGKKVLLLETDYPSVNWAFERRDFNVCYAKVDEDLEQKIEEAISRHRPDIFAFSIVQYLSGIKIDFDFLHQLKAYHPELLLIADGTQYLGTEQFSFSDSAIDVLGCSAYKWLLSGYGNGVFMVKRNIQDKVHPSTIGFNSARAIYNERNNIAFMKHFEPGHQDTLTYGTLQKGIELLERYSLNSISNHLENLCEKAVNAFDSMGLLNSNIANRTNRSTIFNINGDENTFKTLRNEKIVTSMRGNGIRVSFHLYNTEEDLDRLLDFLPNI